jgi:hypothetical protein
VTWSRNVACQKHCARSLTSPRAQFYLSDVSSLARSYTHNIQSSFAVGCAHHDTYVCMCLYMPTIIHRNSCTLWVLVGVCHGCFCNAYFDGLRYYCYYATRRSQKVCELQHLSQNDEGVILTRLFVPHNFAQENCLCPLTSFP